MIEHIFLLSFSRYYITDLNIYKYIFNELRKTKLKHIKSVEIIKPKQIKSDSNNILYFGVFNCKCKVIPKYFIHLNGDTMFDGDFYETSIQLMNKAILIIDYSKNNILKSEKCKHLWDKTFYIPFGYHSYLDNFDNNQNIKIENDIIMFGGHYPARYKFYHEMVNKKYKIKYPNYTDKVYVNENDINKYISTSIISPSILKISKGCNDLHRLRHSICNKRLFIAQKVTDVEINNLFDKYGLLCEYKDVVYKSEELIYLYKNNRTKYVKIANELYNEFVKNYSIINFLNPVINLINNI